MATKKSAKTTENPSNTSSNTGHDSAVDFSHSKTSNVDHASCFTKKELIETYTQMLLIRRFEERCGKIYNQGKIKGFCHLYIGQEAVACGAKHALNQLGHSGSMITSYRCHGMAIASGSNPKNVMAELTGKATGTSGGKGGSMHLFNADGGFFGGHGIVGAQVPLGTGIAFANKYANKKEASLTFLGDGAVSQGQFYESLNMAKIWNLPCVYIIENNQYAMGTAVSRSAANHKKLFERGIGFDVKGEKVDGMNLFEVANAVKNAVEFAVENGPVILEMSTYRYRGHSMSDPAKYRSRSDVDEQKQNRDPIAFVAEYMLAKNIITESALEKIEDEVIAIVDDAQNFADSSAVPTEDCLVTNIY